MLKLRPSLLAASLAVAAAFSPFANAVESTPPMSTPIHVQGAPVSDTAMPHFRQLELSQEQRDKLFELRHQQEPEMRRLHNAVRDARIELRDQANAATFDEAKAKASSDKLARAEADLSLQRTRLHAQSMAILTPEQRAQVEQHRAANRTTHSRGGRHDNMRGSMRGDMGNHAGSRHNGGQHQPRF